MTVEIAWEVAERPLDDEAIRSLVEGALSHGGQAGRDVSVALVDDATLAELHGRYLDDPSPTDVMSFPLGDGPGPWGEVVASVECALRTAAERGVAVSGELALYVVHGTLHLCGLEDGTDAQREGMRAAEAAVLTALGYRR